MSLNWKELLTTFAITIAALYVYDKYIVNKVGEIGHFDNSGIVR